MGGAKAKPIRCGADGVVVMGFASLDSYGSVRTNGTVRTMLCANDVFAAVARTASSASPGVLFNCRRRQTVQRLLGGRHALVHHGADGACGFIREHVGDPGYSGRSVRIRKDFGRAVMVASASRLTRTRRRGVHRRRLSRSPRAPPCRCRTSQCGRPGSRRVSVTNPGTSRV
jgi:hypothetical protein